MPSDSKLTHLDAQGKANMVDVGAKPDSERRAVAAGKVIMKKGTLNAIRDGNIKKGDVTSVARIAGIMGRQADCRANTALSSHRT